MTDRERAKQYLSLFINADERWEYYIPLDVDRSPSGVRFGSVEIGPMRSRPGVWFLYDGHTYEYYRKAVA